MPPTPDAPVVPIDLCFRAAPLSVPTESDQERVVDGIAATEQPVLMPDWKRMRMLPEVLLMGGVQLPADRTVPLLKDHRKQDSDAVLGSAELRVDGDKLLTTNRFSQAESAGDTWTKVKEKHIRSLSVGYKPLKRVYLPEGQTQRISGRSFTGPVHVVTSWAVREVSVTPIGADDQAKMRGYQGTPFFSKENPLHISPIVRAFLESRGMPTGLDDAKVVDFLRDRGMPAELGERSIDDWLASNADKFPAKEPARQDPPAPDPQRDAGGIDVSAIVTQAVQATRQEFAQEQQRRDAHATEVRTACELAGMPELANEMVGSNRTLQEVMADLSQRRAEASPDFHFINFDSSQTDKHTGAMRHGLYARMYGDIAADSTRFEAFVGGKPAPGWEQYRYSSLLDLARDCLAIEGINVRMLSDIDVASMSLMRGTVAGDIDYEGRAGLHTTGHFPNLTLDAINKSMLRGFTEEEFTWSMVSRRGTPAKDFKNIHRVRMSEAKNLDIWPDQTKPEEVKFTDEKESYAVEAYSQTASFSWRSVINDDMDALTRIPRLMGIAAGRTVNTHFWSIWTSNPNLQDAQPIFSAATGNRKKTNLSTGTLSVASLSAAKAVMRQQVGVNTPGGNASPAVLNIVPKYLIVPTAIETTAEQLLNSAYDHDGTALQKPNAKFVRNLTEVAEPLLDATSTAQWYLSADPNRHDTFETTFLQGYETPRRESWRDFETKSRKYNITIVFAHKCMDFRGLLRSSGS